MVRTLILFCFSLFLTKLAQSNVILNEIGNKKGQCVDVDEYFRVPDDEGDDEEPTNLGGSPISRDLPDSGSDAVCPPESNGNCQPGWKNFTRPSGEWCVKIFFENSINQSTAESRCQAHGATLSGFQNQIELQYVLSTTSSAIAPQTGSVWIGVKRREECANVGRTRNCTSLTSFEWTDKSASGTDGFLWACNQPDNAWKHTQQCAVLTASSTGYVIGYQTGTMDDVACDFDFIKQNRKPRDIKAYVCGKKP